MWPHTINAIQKIYSRRPWWSFLSESTAPGWRNKCHLLLAFFSLSFQFPLESFFSAHCLASLLSQQEWEAIVRIAEPTDAIPTRIDVIYVLTADTHSGAPIVNYWCGFIQRLLMAPGGQVSPCSERRRIDSRSENKLALADQTRTRRQEKDSVEFSLRRGDVWLMLRDFGFCYWLQIARCDDSRRGEIG